MAYVIADRTQQTTTTTGTGTITLGGTVAGFRTFASVCSNGDSVPYCITDQLNNWEVGVGTFTTVGTTLARTTILASSNNGAVVNFTTTSNTVFLTIPAAQVGPYNYMTGTMSATTFNSLSDEKVKTDIKTILNAVDTISQLRGVEFKWKTTGTYSAGVIAQELEQTLPSLVVTDDLGRKTVNYSGIIGYLINSIQELNKRVRYLESK
jgi:hypothetical protein